MALGLVLVGAWGLAWCGVRTPRRTSEGGREPVGAAAAAPEGITAPLGRSVIDAPASRTLPDEPTWIRGRVRMSDGDACRSGSVFAWRVGFVPSAADFAAERLRSGTSPIRAAPIRADGSFELEGLAPAERYTLGAAAPGGALAERPSLVPPGREGVELRLRYLLGLAILLEDARGGPLRTSPGFFGRGPSASGPGTKLLENPPELAALPITGLEPGHGSRDRWQYLALSETRIEELGPIEYGVEVPGYAPTDVRLQARPVLDRLEEVRVRLEPVAEDWGALDVALVGAPHVRDLGLPEDELVGVVRLVRDGDEPWEARTIGSRCGPAR